MSWWETQSLIIADAKLYVVFDEQCICIKADGSSELIEDLEYNQEEANTWKLLYAQHICHSTENVIIHAPETDVLIITITIPIKISGNLCIYTGTKSNTRTISIENRKSKTILDALLRLTRHRITSKSLLSFYAFTECDTVSTFYGKGKLKPIEVMLKNPKYINEFLPKHNRWATSNFANIYLWCLWT